MLDQEKDINRAKQFQLDWLKRNMKSEYQLETYFLLELEKAGVFAVKMNPVNNSGMPDIFVFYKKRFWPVELKTEKGRTSFNQQIFHSRLAEHGHPVTVLYGKEQVDKFINQIKEL